MRRRIGLAMCVAWFLAAMRTSAAAPFDPTARGIDRVCNAYVPSAAPRDVVTLVRIATHDGSVPKWRRSDPAAATRLQAAADFSGGDVATVVFDRGSVVFADTVHTDATAPQTQTRAWCFIGGKLSRSTSENVDAAAVIGWRRTLYYGDDLDKPLSEYVTAISGAGTSDRRARAPLEELGVDAYATPARLPFYADAVAALPGGKRHT